MFTYTLITAGRLRAVFLATVVVLSLTACSTGGVDNESDQTVYRINIAGSAGFLSGGEQSFSHSGLLYILPTIDNTNASGNGVNPVDVAIVTDASPIVGELGALWFGTNTSTCVVVNCTLGESRVDIAHVTQNNNRITVQVDGNVFGLPTARINTFNIYNVTTGVTAQIHNVLLGEMEITINESQLGGQFVLNGNSGFGHPAPTTFYQAVISGQRQE